MIPDDFMKIIEKVNLSLVEFNRFLNPNNSIPLIELCFSGDNVNACKIIHGKWNEWSFPNNATKRGVYLILGKNIANTNEVALYIGKASLSSHMGDRLYAHLHKYKNTPYYLMNGTDESQYILDYIVAIDLDSIGVWFLAPALEEFLISNLKEQITLMNGTGNS
jgi:hypothetical protein